MVQSTRISAIEEQEEEEDEMKKWSADFHERRRHRKREAKKTTICRDDRRKRRLIGGGELRTKCRFVLRVHTFYRRTSVCLHTVLARRLYECMGDCFLSFILTTVTRHQFNLNYVSP